MRTAAPAAPHFHEHHLFGFGPTVARDPKARNRRGDACKQWLADHLARGTRVVVPEIVEYELRRELLRAKKANSLRRLDAFLGAETDRFIPLSRPAILRAAELWAQSRQRGRPTADPKELDIDVVQAARLLTAGFDPKDVTIATANVGHLAQFLRAEDWRRV